MGKIFSKKKQKQFHEIMDERHEINFERFYLYAYNSKERES